MCTNDTYVALHTVSFVHGCFAEKCVLTGSTEQRYFKADGSMEKKWDTVIPANLKRLCERDMYAPLVTKGITTTLPGPHLESWGANIHFYQICNFYPKIIHLKINLHEELFLPEYCLATSGCNMCISIAYFFYSNKMCVTERLNNKYIYNA
jgi:hypothetical protein